jgi:hypothetical protein
VNCESEFQRAKKFEVLIDVLNELKQDKFTKIWAKMNDRENFQLLKINLLQNLQKSDIRALFRKKNDFVYL